MKLWLSISRILLTALAGAVMLLPNSAMASLPTPTDMRLSQMHPKTTSSLPLRAKYTPYGTTLINPASNNDQAGFTGHIKDSATGLTYMQARYYDPLIGRFLSIDPVGFSVGQPQMFNRYMYVNNDPVNGTDPDGKKIKYKGTWKEKRALKKAVKKIRKSNPKSAARYKTLKKSKNVHSLRFPKKGEGPENKTTGTRANESNSVGTGSETIVDPTKSVETTNSDGTKVTNSGETVVTHEFLGHGFDKDQGQIDRSTNPATGERRSEESAMGAENEFKDAVGETRRDKH